MKTLCSVSKTLCYSSATAKVLVHSRVFTRLSNVQNYNRLKVAGLAAGRVMKETRHILRPEKNLLWERKSGLIGRGVTEKVAMGGEVGVVRKI